MGYSRAVRSGNFIAVTGTVGINADGTYAKTVGEQAQRSLAIIKAAIEALGGKLEHVIRTRMYVTDVSEWEQVAAAHGAMFGEIRPATQVTQAARCATFSGVSSIANSMRLAMMATLSNTRFAKQISPRAKS